ncbi:type VI secretion system tube protein Hcp, partial [Enterobacter roggenkampii]
KIGPDPRNFNQRVSLGRNDLLIRTFLKTTLENARVVQIEPVMFDIKHPQNEHYTHHEYVDLIYEKITWHYIDGNFIHSDTWKERA